MRALKWIGIGLGTLVVLLGIGLVLVVTLVDPNAYRGRLQDIVRARTGRELVLQGDLKLSVFPWLAVELGPATLGNAPGFGTEPMLAIRHARLGLKLWPLLHKRFEVGSVRLEGPAARLEVDAQGRDNWSNLLQGRAPPAAGAAPPALQGSIASIVIEDGSLVYVDRRAGTMRKLGKLALRTGRLQAGRAFPLELRALAEPDPKSRIEVDLETRARIEPEHRRYEFEAPTLKLRLAGAAWPRDGLPVTAQFSRVVADFGAQTLQLAGLRLDAAGARVSGELAGTSILDAPHISGRIRLADVAPRALLGQFGIDAPATRDAKVLQHLSLDGDLDASRSAMAVKGLKGRLDDTALAGSVGADFDSGTLRFNLQLDRIDADRYLAPAAPLAAGGQGAAGARAPIAIPVDLIRGLELQGDLRAGAARFAGIQYSKLHFGLSAHAGRVRIHPSEAQMYGGQYRGDIGLDVSGALPRASFDEHVGGVDFAALFRDMFDSRRFGGRGNASAQLSASGRDTAAMLRTLAGNVSFDVQDGALEGVDLWYEIRRARALLKREAPPQRTGPERTPFTLLRASGRVDHGVLSNDDLVATTAYLKVRGRGTIDLAAATLDYRLEADVPRAIDQLDRDAAEAADLAGFTIPVRVTGALADPKLRPDLEGLAKAEAKRQIEKKKEEVEQQLKEKLKSKLKGLLGGG